MGDSLFLLPAVGLLAFQTPWPSFRGPDRSGRAPEARLPATFDPDLDRLWRRDLEPGHSSPVLAGEGIYLTVRREGRTTTVCLAAADGRTLWERDAPEPEPEPSDTAAERPDPALLAATTPVTDGRGVFVSCPTFGLVAYELTGEERWRLPLGRLHAPYPPASSPAWADGRVVHLCDHDRGSFLLAVDAESGDVLWRTERPFATHGFSSPTILDDVVVVSGSQRVDAYSLADGRLVWWAEGMSWQPRATPVGGDGLVFVQSAVQTVRELGLRVVSETWAEACSAWDSDRDDRLAPAELTEAELPGEFTLHDLDGDGALDEAEWANLGSRARSGSGLWALRLGGAGDVTATHVAWYRRRGVPLSATPILVDGVLVTVRDGGLALGLDASDGAERWVTRIDGMGGNVFSSPISLGSRVLTIDAAGALALLDARDGRVLGVHDLGEEVWATPAVGDGRLFVRTTGALQAFRLGADEPGAETQALVGVEVLTMGPEGHLSDQTLLVRDGRVAALGPREETVLPPGTSVLARGPDLTVAPGLVDMWVRVEDEGELVRHLLAGVTTIRSVDGRPALLALRERVRAGTAVGPEWVVGGPVLDAGISPADVLGAVSAAAAAGYDFVGAEVGLAAESWTLAAARARELGLPFAGVRPTDLPLEETLAAAPWTLDRLETLVDEPDLWLHLSRSGVPVTPLVAAHSTWVEAASRRAEWIANEAALREVSPVVRVLWSPAAHALWRGLGRRDVPAQKRSRRAQREALGEWNGLHGPGVELLAGSDSLSSFVHPGAGLHHELSVLAASGLPPERVLRAATSVPGRVLARVLGEARGTLTVGAVADLIVVRGDPLASLRILEEPAGTMVAGRWTRRATLEERLAGFRATYARESGFVQAVAARRPAGTAGLIEYLRGPEVSAAELREGTARRMIELLLHPRVARVEDAAAVSAFVERRWPVASPPGEGDRP